MERYALTLQVVITALQGGTAVAWLLSGDGKQFLFWLGLFICNAAYISMVWR